MASQTRFLAEHRIQLIVLGLLVIIAYGFTLNFAFVSDDVTGIRTFDFTNAKHLFANPFQLARPVMYWITNAVFGKQPWAFRLPNVLFHLGVVYVMYALLLKLVNRQAAMIAAVLVAIHPALIEAVTWISGGGYAGYTLFCLISLYLFIQRRHHVGLYWLSIVSFFIGLEISEKAVVLPALILLYGLLFETHFKWKASIPYWLLSIVWIAKFAGFIGMRSTSLATNFSASTATTMHPLMRMLITEADSLLIVLLPFRLTLYHSEVTSTLFLTFCRIGLLTLFGLPIIWFLRRHTKSVRAKSLAFWAVVFVASLSPVIASGNLGWIVAERYLYFGAVGILAIVAIGVDWVVTRSRRQDLFVMIGIIISLTLLLLTIRRNLDWRNEDTLWLAAGKTSPNSSQNNNNLGDLYMRRQDPARAIYYFNRATLLHPCYGDAYHNLAQTYAAVNKFPEAIDNFNKAVKCKPNLWQSHLQLAYIYYTQKNLPLAQTELAAASSINPAAKDIARLRELIGTP